MIRFTHHSCTNTYYNYTIKLCCSCIQIIILLSVECLIISRDANAFAIRCAHPSCITNTRHQLVASISLSRSQFLQLTNSYVPYKYPKVPVQINYF